MAEPATGAAADLRADVLVELRSPVDAAPDDARFNALALRIFAHQYEHNRAYAAYSARRGRTPDSITHWTEIPPVPTAAFREMPLVAGDPAHARLVFRTSGTTQGSERRGMHYVLDPALYEASLLPNFAAHLLPDGGRPRMIAFLPSFTELSDSSLAYMVDTVMRELGSPDSSHVVDAAHGIDVAAALAALDDACSDGVPVCLLGTSFSFVHFLDALEQEGRTFALPPGSRLMDTGGYKGRSRDVPADELRAQYEARLGLDPSYCINEYGMTELSSQYYDANLLDAVRSRGDRPRRKTGPPWLRARIVHPETLEPVGPGDTGILLHVDLANVNSVLAVLTEDQGSEVDDGFVVHGRAAGAAPRGCSIALDDLLRARQHRT